MAAHIIVLAIAAIMDQIIHVIFPSDYLIYNLLFIPNLAFCCMILTVRSWKLIDACIFAFIFGMFYDYFLAQTFLVYAMTFSVVVCLVRVWTKHITDTLVECIIICIVTIFAKDLIVYFYMIFMGVSSISFMEWLQTYELLTVVGNGLLSIGLYYILRKKNELLTNKDKRQRKGEKIEWYRLKSK